MIDERDLLERATRQFSPDVGIVERVYRRRDRKHRNLRIGTAGLALILAAVAAAGVVFAFRNSGSRPANEPVNKQVVAPDVEITRESVRGFFLMSLDGEKLGKIPNLPKGAADVSVSPDGRTIAFSHGTYTGIWTIGVDGTNLRRVGRQHTTSPSWSPDGSMIASFGYGRIHTVNADGTHPGATSACGVKYGSLIAHPKWSPDRTEILCSRIQGRGPAHGNVQVVVYDVPLDNGSYRSFTALAGAAGVNAWDGAWSPDGTQIAFSSGDTGADFDWFPANPAYDIWIMHADGSNQRPLVESNEGADVGPFWSPDGRMIAYTSVAETRSVWVVEVSSGVKRLVGPGTVFGWSTPATLIVGRSS